MADSKPGRGLSVVDRISMLCDFIDHPVIRSAVQQGIPVTMPPAVGALGFDMPLWIGLGTVGLWASLDAFAERSGLSGTKCPTCHTLCIGQRFAAHCQGAERQALDELEDLRHLHAHNYAGEADEEYAKRRTRHLLIRGRAVDLSVGVRFDGYSVRMDHHHLKAYAEVVGRVLRRCV